MKKSTLFIIILVILLVSAGAFYWFTRSQGGNLNLNLNNLPIFPSSEDKELPNTDNLSSSTPIYNSNSSIEATNPEEFFQSQERVLGPYLLANKDTEKIFYTDKESGHLFEIRGNKGEKIINETTPSPQESYIIPTENGLIYGVKYEKSGSINNKWVILSGYNPFKTASNTSSTLKKYDLPINFYTLAVSPDYSKIFYLIQTSSGSDGYVMDIKTKKTKKIFFSRLTDWKISWPSTELVTLQTKNSYLTGGFLYSLNVTSGKVEKEISDIKGLSALMSPDGKKIIYSATFQGEPYLYLKDKTKGSQTRVGLKTLAEKCIWSKDSNLIYCAVPKTILSANYPDEWYKGKKSFQDQIWSIDFSTLETLRLFDLTLLKIEPDVSQMVITKSGDLYFTIKSDNLARNLSLGGIAY